VIERGEALKSPPLLTRIAIRYKDLVPYGHVNNAAYLEFFEEIHLAYRRALADPADLPGARWRRGSVTRSEGM